VNISYPIYLPTFITSQFSSPLSADYRAICYRRSPFIPILLPYHSSLPLPASRFRTSVQLHIYRPLAPLGTSLESNGTNFAHRISNFRGRSTEYFRFLPYSRPQSRLHTAEHSADTLIVYPATPLHYSAFLATDTLTATVSAILRA
jgi:hypothetical protein